MTKKDTEILDDTSSIDETIMKKIEETKNTTKQKSNVVEKVDKSEEKPVENKIAVKKPSVATDESSSVSSYKITDDQLNKAKEELEKLTEAELSDGVDDDSYVVENDKDEDSTEKTCFVKGLNYDLRENQLKEDFSKYGNIVRLEVPMKNDKSRNNGYCFVQFETKNEADLFKEKLDKTIYMERTLEIQKATSTKNTMGKVFTVFVKNLSFNVTKEMVENKFKAFGKLHCVSVPEDDENKGRNKGFAFVEFKREEDARKAMSKDIFINKRKCFMTEGNKNGPRKRQLDKKYGRSGAEDGTFEKRPFKEHNLSKKTKFTDEVEKERTKKSRESNKVRTDKMAKSNKIVFNEESE